MTNEQIISDFMQKHYTDERLSWLLAHAESGQLSFYSCCCFIGVPTADHALRAMGQTLDDFAGYQTHYLQAKLHQGAIEAEDAFKMLADQSLGGEAQDEDRRAKLIPLIRAEIQRRETIANRESQYTLNLKAALVELGEKLQEVGV